MATVPRAPLFSKPGERPADVGLRTWVSGNPNLYTNPIPFKQTDWPVSPASARELALRTCVSFNPNLYTAVAPATVPFQNPDLSPPRAIAYPAHLRADIPPNIVALVWGSVAYQTNQTQWDVPLVPKYADHLRTWAWNGTLYVPTGPAPTPVVNVDFPVPAGRPASIELRTWIAGKPGIYTNPIPAHQTDWPTPPERRYDLPLRHWAAFNSNLYKNAVPFVQTNWPIPPARAHSMEHKTWGFETNPNLLPPPPPPTIRGNWLPRQRRRGRR